MWKSKKYTCLMLFFLLCGCACKPNAVARFSLFQRWEYKLGGFLWIFNYKAFSFSCNGDCWTFLSGLYTQVHSVHFQQHSVVALTLLRSIFYCMYCWKFTHTVECNHFCFFPYINFQRIDGVKQCSSLAASTCIHSVLSERYSFTLSRDDSLMRMHVCKC